MSQIYVEVARSVVWIAMAVVFAVACFYLLKYTIKNYEEMCRNDTEPAWIVSCIVLSIIAVVLFFISIGEITDLVQYIVNPEYSAFQIVLQELSRLR